MDYVEGAKHEAHPPEQPPPIDLACLGQPIVIVVLLSNFFAMKANLLHSFSPEILNIAILKLHCSTFH